MALPLSEIAGELLRTPRAPACDASLRSGEECDACRSFPGGAFNQTRTARW